MASNEAVKSESSDEQKRLSEKADEVQYSDPRVIGEALKLYRRELREQPAVDGQKRPEEVILEDPEIAEKLAGNTRSAQRWNDLCKKEEEKQYSNVAHGPRGPLAALHSKDVAVPICKIVIKKAVEHFRKTGRFPETTDQVNVREKKESKAEIQEMRKKIERLQDSEAQPKRLEQESDDRLSEPPHPDPKLEEEQDGMPPTPPPQPTQSH